VPALPPVPGTLRARIGGVIGTIPWNVITHLAYSGGVPTAADALAFATWLYGIVQAGDGTHTFASLADNETALEFVTVTDLASSMGVEETYLQTIDGARSGHPIAAQVSALLKYDQPLRYRGGHPRSYWHLGVSEDLTNPAEWSSAFVTACEDWAFAIGAAMATGHTSGGVTVDGPWAVSYFSGHAPRVTPLVLPLTMTAIAPRPCTMRRRLGKVGG